MKDPWLRPRCAHRETTALSISFMPRSALCGQALITFLLQSRWLFVGGQTRLSENFCGGRGLINSNLTCSCFSGFRGPDCSLRACPVGRAWIDFPSESNVAHADGVECSNMGNCDRVSGTCVCRDGFVGQACDRLSCPSSCSGHGKCLSMAEAASEWDGRLLVRPNVEYTSVWDAHILYGCVCDPGWIGHDCSQLECPTGDDPLTPGQTNEVVRIVCQADSGGFVFSFRGVVSAAIPFNASYGYVEELLENMETIDDVDVSMSGDGAVCGQAGEVVTTVEFSQEFGDLPAALVSSVDLELEGEDPRLSMETLLEIVCPICPSCTGGIYVIYDDETTSIISPYATNFEIESEIRRLDTLGTASAYGNMTWINVTTTVDEGGSLCDSGYPVTTSIRLRCPYGNLPAFTIINSVRDVDGEKVTVNLRDGQGTKENEYCSNHGVCDFETGTCVCDRNTTQFPNDWYWWESSDGYGGSGARGDCGYQRQESATNVSQSCPVGIVFSNETMPMYETMDQVICSGKGTCNGATGGCSCYPGFYGGDCNQIRCPTGKAWFDEARANNVAHSHGVECGAMGNCDHDTGRCMCRKGWTGAACERLACSSDCSGNGACLPMYRLAQLRQRNGQNDPVAYGFSDFVRPFGSSVFLQPKTWDFDMMYGCLCDSGSREARGGDQVVENGFYGYGGIFRPRAGPRSYVSGVYTENAMLSGWTGYRCDLRTCPTGDNTRTYGGEFDVQTVACTLDEGEFTISFREATTEGISVNAKASEVAAAMEKIPTIGSVSVEITSGNTSCNSAWNYGEGIRVTFLTELGPLPLLTTTPSMSVNKTIVGTKEIAECGVNGICDHETGLCACLDGWASSDGNAAKGDRGDCGYRNEFCTDKSHEVFTNEEMFAILVANAK